jgi:hypothetical protein
MPIEDYNISGADYKPGDLPGEITKTVNELKDEGITSREQLLAKYDVDAPARLFELIKGIGPERAAIVVWLRGKTIEEWRELTGLPAFSDPGVEAKSLTDALADAQREFEGGLPTNTGSNESAEG